MAISSHLLDIGNHSSVYSACTEIASMWEELGSRLSVYRPSVETIRADGEDVSDCLRRLLDVWLKRSSPDQPLPSWRRLCDALSYLNRTLSDRISFQHQCGCSQCTAVEMLFQQYKELCEKMKDPVTIAEYMCTEASFTLEQLERIKDSSGDEKEALFTALESAVSENHYNLKIFATALLMEQDTSSFGKSLLSKYKNERNYSQHTKEVEVNMEYSREFQMMRNELGKLCGNTVCLLIEKKIEMSSFIFTLGYSFPELMNDLKKCKSLPEAMAEVIRPRVSLIQIDYLEVIYENFALPRDSIDAYKEKIESFCNRMAVEHAYGQDLMDELARHISKLESIAFTLDWEGNEHCLKDLLGLFKKLVGQYSKRLKVKVAFPKKSFIVQCYVPSYLQSLIVRMIQQNEKILHEEKVLSVTAGGATVFTQASQVSKPSKEVLMGDTNKVSDNRDDISAVIRPTVAEICSKLEKVLKWEKTVIHLMLQHAVHVLRGHSTEWSVIGLGLGVPLDVRDELRNDTGLSNTDRLEKVIDYWLKKECHPPVTWGRLIEILEGLL